MNRSPIPRRVSPHVRRTPVRREVRPLKSIQLVGAIIMAVCLVGLASVCIAPAFAGRIIEIHGDKYTSQSIIKKIVGIDSAPNLFLLRTDQAAAKLVDLPAVKSATVVVKLPSTVVVTIVEREPKLVWVIGGTHFVVDDEGMLFGTVDAAGNPIASDEGPLASPTPVTLATDTPEDTASATPTEKPSATPRPTRTPKPKPTPTRDPKATPTKPGPKASPTPEGSPTPSLNPSLVPSLLPAPTTDPRAASGPHAIALAMVFDRRAVDAHLKLGGVIDPINLDAAYRLANLTPADVGSTAAGLAVVLDDEHGFTVSSVPDGWVGQFGFYAAVIRKPTVIPTQVRDLRSALAQWGESKVAWVFLVSDVSPDHVLTVILR